MRTFCSTGQGKTTEKSLFMGLSCTWGCRGRQLARRRPPRYNAATLNRRLWRGAGVADRAALEVPCTLLSTVGSNPTLSVTLTPPSTNAFVHRHSLAGVFVFEAHCPQTVPNWGRAATEVVSISWAPEELVSHAPGRSATRSAIPRPIWSVDLALTDRDGRLARWPNSPTRQGQPCSRPMHQRRLPSRPGCSGG